MKKNVLLSIAGLTPQVITETLYGIHQEQQSGADWSWPDEIQVITTSLGKEQIILGLLTKDDHQMSMLEKLCRDYHRPVPQLREDLIFVIPDEHGAPVSDARSKQDHEALATFIVRHVAQICSQDDPQVRLHASLAGGRKTMTFFLGYALALFAREGDKLSHVLVDELYEGNRHFYYPTPTTHAIPARDGNSHIDASKAAVTLAEIPFIRHKDIHTKGSLSCLEKQSYRDLTYYQNAMQNPDEIRLVFHLVQKRVTILDKVIDFSSKPLELAFYAMIAVNQCRTDSQPIVMSNNDPDNLWLADQLLQQLEIIAALRPQDHSAALLEGDKFSFMREFRDRATRLTESDVLLRGAGEQTIARTYLELNYGMSAKFLNDKKNSLKKFLLEHFPADIVAYIAPAQVYVKGEWPKRRVFDGSGQQGTPLGLWIENERITIR
ncbi:CRISPR-associated ring nuclease Csm6 [Vibrio sp. MarTm2]|uniref:CRISPR-associated ring nuclease Csm6 n=1 Tax=Vibrio sp. MarTm2 TaxID=2998831 RepID=UPI0022CD9601|nr:CRISPR-associated ring nuclease Csm6 [Vibrio sp. MarTm2]MDA0129460.1 CRISPR-associated ring nuclease Csm6 [Vibrio sp. MarTm2]